jgi:hypothetical protein
LEARTRILHVPHADETRGSTEIWVERNNGTDIGSRCSRAWRNDGDWVEGDENEICTWRFKE